MDLSGLSSTEIIIIAVIWAISAVATAYISTMKAKGEPSTSSSDTRNPFKRVFQARQKAKEKKANDISAIRAELEMIKKDIADMQLMAIRSTGDKLRHYANKYLVHPDVDNIQAIKDWLDLEEAYEKNGGNHIIPRLRPMMENLLVDLEMEKERMKDE